MVSRLWPFVVTWRHRSRDHSTPRGRVPMGGPWWQASIWRKYGASNIIG